MTWRDIWGELLEKKNAQPIEYDFWENAHTRSPFLSETY